MDKKPVGRPSKNEADKKAKGRLFKFSKEVAERLETLPPGTMTQFVENAIKLSFDVLDGKVKFVYAESEGNSKDVLAHKDADKTASA